VKARHARRIRLGILSGRAHAAVAVCITRGRYIIKPVADPLEWKATTHTLRRAFRRALFPTFIVGAEANGTYAISRIPAIPSTLTNLSGKKKK